MTSPYTILRRIAILFSTLLLALALTACGEDGQKGDPGPEGPQGEQGPPGEAVDAGTSVEACAGCHGTGTEWAVGDINDEQHVHYIDADGDGLMTESGLRRLDVTITEVDVTGANVVIEFDVDSEVGSFDEIFASDGRFTIAKLIDPTDADALNTYDPNYWQSLIETTEDPGGVGDGPGTPEQQATYERFTSSSGVFENLGGGSYRYTSSFDPSSGSFPVAAGETMRVAIQIDADDIPVSNGWCNFDADLGSPNDCTSGVSRTRDIVQTDTCNSCHGPTDDTQLGIHGGGRTDVEYCVTCHNPGTTDANSGNTVDMTVMIHKIHAGAQLENGYKIWGFRNSLHDYSEVGFTKDLDNCQVCHTGGGTDEDNWWAVPSIQACESCHDDVDIVNGVNHPVALDDNQLCTNCHIQPPADVREVHRFPQRQAESDLYTGPGNGFIIEPTTDFDPSTDELTVDFSVVRDGVPADLELDPEWLAGSTSRLALLVGWEASEYTNEGSGSSPGLPISIDVLGGLGSGAVTANPDDTYTAVVDLGDASGTVTIALEGHPAADIEPDPNDVYETRIAVVNPYLSLDIEGGRTSVTARRDVVDVTKCNGCHDYSGQGVSLHGNNRTGEMQVCVMCHTGNSTDINRRPDDPADTADGKVEESIDFKRMIHQIHMGSDLENGVVIWGFGFPGTEHDFSDIDFTGNMANCETCHFPGTYGTEDAWAALPTTISTGDDADDPSDDINISPTASVCSSCHDSDVSQDHMVLHGASFQALDEDIH